MGRPLSFAGAVTSGATGIRAGNDSVYFGSSLTGTTLTGNGQDTFSLQGQTTVSLGQLQHWLASELRIKCRYGDILYLVAASISGNSLTLTLLSVGQPVISVQELTAWFSGTLNGTTVAGGADADNIVSSVSVGSSGISFGVQVMTQLRRSVVLALLISGTVMPVMIQSSSAMLYLPVEPEQRALSLV